MMLHFKDNNLPMIPHPNSNMNSETEQLNYSSSSRHEANKIKKQCYSRK